MQTQTTTLLIDPRHLWKFMDGDWKHLHSDQTAHPVNAEIAETHTIMDPAILDEFHEGDKLICTDCGAVFTVADLDKPIAKSDPIQIY